LRREKNQSCPSGTTASILTSAATIDTPSNVSLVSGVLGSKTTGSISYGCSYTPAGSDTTTTGTTFATTETIISTSTFQANLFTAPGNMTVNTLTLQLRKVGGPGGSMLTEIYGSSGSQPAGSALGASSNVLISSIPTLLPFGNAMTFTLASALQLASGTTYAVVLRLRQV